MPKILILTRHIESASFRQRIALYFKSLSHAGIEYDVEPLPASSLKTIKILKKADSFDAVILHKKRLNPVQRFSLRRNAKKIIYDFDDAVMYDYQYPEIPHIKKMKRFADTVKMADTVLAGNNFLANLAKEFNKNIVVLPTGLDTAEYNMERKPSIDKNIRLVWIGSGSNLAYLKQIRQAIEQLSTNYKNVVLRIICNEFLDMRHTSIEKIQWSLTSQISNLVNSDIGIAPLPDNNFTRGKCGFKILQYCAASLPVVASPVGVNADLVQDRVNGFLAETDSQWFDCLDKLICSPGLRHNMGKEAKRIAADYDVSILEKKFIDTITNTLSNDS
ncbi:MAG: glycosyltransferase family 4 protein [Sedimentisphaerales bacterium]|nr:glycosyltransferase family 4 protein [Sedimentisphaerales bacterium]